MCEKFNEIGEQMPIPPSLPTGYVTKEELLSALQDILLGCEVAERGLNAFLKPLVEPELANRLDSIKEHLTRLEEQGVDLSVIKNLRKAVEEAEHAHYLASAMISSRVIRYIVDKIPGKKDEDKVRHLVETRIVSPKKKDEVEELMRAMRRSRNFLSHRIDLFPEAGDVLVLLGGALSLSKFLLVLKRK